MPRKEMQIEVAANIRMIFNALDRVEAEEYLKEAIRKYEKISMKLANWMELNISEGLTFFSFPASHLQRIRTTNSLELLNR